MKIPFADLEMWAKLNNREPFNSAHARAKALLAKSRSIEIDWIETDLIQVRETGGPDDQPAARRRNLVEQEPVRRRVPPSDG